MKIDLHAHTTHSDGLFTPTLLIEEAARRGVGIQAVTDHDTVGGVSEALAAGERLGVRVLWGLEFSARDAAGDVHVLGYFPARPPEPFLGMLARQRGRRKERAEAMMARLRTSGMVLTWEDLEAAGASDDSVGRPHLARAMQAKGYVGNFNEAFKRWLSPGQPGYVQHEAPSPEETVAEILRAGGVSVAAHPGRLRDPGILERMIGAGLKGIEVFHPDHNEEKRRRFSELAFQKGLVATGGSDFHGMIGERFAKLGDYPTPEGEWDRLKALWG